MYIKLSLLSYAGKEKGCATLLVAIYISRLITFALRVFYNGALFEHDYYATRISTVQITIISLILITKYRPVKSIILLPFHACHRCLTCDPIWIL